jgi:hypothetical protein
MDPFLLLSRRQQLLRVLHSTLRIRSDVKTDNDDGCFVMQPQSGGECVCVRALKKCSGCCFASIKKHACTWNANVTSHLFHCRVTGSPGGDLCSLG